MLSEIILSFLTKNQNLRNIIIATRFSKLPEILYRGLQRNTFVEEYLTIPSLYIDITDIQHV